jgi:hypothetical protein
MSEGITTDTAWWIVWAYGFAAGSVVGMCLAIIASIRLCFHWYGKARARGVPVGDFGTSGPGRDNKG